MVTKHFRAIFTALLAFTALAGSAQAGHPSYRPYHYGRPVVAYPAWSFRVVGGYPVPYYAYPPVYAGPPVAYYPPIVTPAPTPYGVTIGVGVAIRK